MNLRTHTLSNVLGRVLGVGLLALIAVLLLTPHSSIAQEMSGKRRVVARSAPDYPFLARSMSLVGVVRVEALVLPDGSVKSVSVKGGHPILVQSAVSAVSKWKWEAAQHESREAVEVKFSPE